MFDFYAFILQLILMANANAAQGMQWNPNGPLNESSFSAPPAAAQAPERTRIREQRGL